MYCLPQQCGEVMKIVPAGVDRGRHKLNTPSQGPGAAGGDDGGAGVAAAAAAAAAVVVGSPVRGKLAKLRSVKGDPLAGRLTGKTSKKGKTTSKKQQQVGTAVASGAGACRRACGRPEGCCPSFQAGAAGCSLLPLSFLFLFPSFPLPFLRRYTGALFFFFCAPPARFFSRLSRIGHWLSPEVERQRATKDPQAAARSGAHDGAGFFSPCAKCAGFKMHLGAGGLVWFGLV